MSKMREISEKKRKKTEYRYHNTDVSTEFEAEPAGVLHFSISKIKLEGRNKKIKNAHRGKSFFFCGKSKTSENNIFTHGFQWL